MTVVLYRHAWGAVGPNFTWQSLPKFTRDAAAEGYAGVEFPLFYFEQQPEGKETAESQFREALAETELDFIPLIATLPEKWGDYDGHLASFRAQIARATEWGVSKASVHAGADSFDDETVIKFYKETTSVARDAGIEPYYETHRARPFFNPFRTVKLLDALPDIWLTADFAHWVPVVDRLPYDLADLFAICAARTGHLHARIGYDKGPQVPDPRDPVWDAYTAVHEEWWDLCVQGAIERGETMAITPEFGPFPYLLHHPHTSKPIADVTEVVAWMRQRLSKRYNI